MYYATFSLLLAITLTLGIGQTFAPGTATYVGTFSQTSCEPTRFGCTSIGTWVSNDRSIVRNNTSLDGSVSSDGTVQATYTPTGFNNDKDNNVVHTAAWSWLKPWMPWLLSIAFAGFIAVRVFEWRKPKTRSSAAE